MSRMLSASFPLFTTFDCNRIYSKSEIARKQAQVEHHFLSILIVVMNHGSRIKKTQERTRL